MTTMSPIVRPEDQQAAKERAKARPGIVPLVMVVVLIGLGVVLLAAIALVD